MQGTVKRGRRPGRQRKRWEDNIREWTGLKFAKSQKAVENREKWRKLVVKLSVVPQRPSWLRDRSGEKARRGLLTFGRAYSCIKLYLYGITVNLFFVFD